MSCAQVPVALPITNVTLANGNIMRGVEVAVGTPAQNFAFMPQLYNNSYLYDTSSPDDNRTKAFITTLRGGLYDATSSRSTQSFSSLALAGGAPGQEYNSGQDVWVQDTVALSSNTTLSDFPLGIYRDGTDSVDYNQPQSILGMGMNSSILTTLKQTGKIASRTWSIFWGLTGAARTHQSDGTFVIGGYDAAKIDGANYTKALSSDNRMLVDLTDIRLQYPNGSSYSLYTNSQSSALRASILPYFPGVMTLPYDRYTTFQDLTQTTSIGRSFGVNFYGMTFDPRFPIFPGSLILEIDNLFTVTISNDQLITPDITIGSAGKLNANYSSDELLINSLQADNINDLPILGRNFLSSAMIMVNQDARTFTLWQASPSAQQSLVAVDSKGNAVTTVCNGSTNGTNSNQTTGASDSGTNNNTSSTPVGAIAGGVVGGVAVIALIVGGLIWFLRRRKALAQAQPEHPPSYEDPKQTFGGLVAPAAQPATTTTSEQKAAAAPYTEHYAVHEVDGYRAPAEMPAESVSMLDGQGRPRRVNSVHELG